MQQIVVEDLTRSFRVELLFLDEPTIGLDAVSKLAVREFIGRLNRERGVTVILSTHDMDDIEALCRRVMVIGNGQILSDGTLADLRASVTGERWLTVDLAESAAATVVTDPDAQLIRQEGRRFGRFSQALIVLFWSAGRLNVEWSPGNITLLLGGI